MFLRNEIKSRYFNEKNKLFRFQISKELKFAKDVNRIIVEKDVTPEYPRLNHPSIWHNPFDRSETYITPISVGRISFLRLATESNSVASVDSASRGNIVAVSEYVL